MAAESKTLLFVDDNYLQYCFACAVLEVVNNLNYVRPEIRYYNFERCDACKQLIQIMET